MANAYLVGYMWKNGTQDMSDDFIQQNYWTTDYKQSTVTNNDTAINSIKIGDVLLLKHFRETKKTTEIRAVGVVISNNDKKGSESKVLVTWINLTNLNITIQGGTTSTITKI